MAALSTPRLSTSQAMLGSGSGQVGPYGGGSGQEGPPQCMIWPGVAAEWRDAACGRRGGKWAVGAAASGTTAQMGLVAP